MEAMRLPSPGDEPREGGRLHRLRRRMQLFGIAATLGFVARALLRRAIGYREYLLYRGDTATIHPSAGEIQRQKSLAGLHFHWLSEPDFTQNPPLFAQILEGSLMYTIPEMVASLQRGDRCLAIFSGNELVHASWINRQNSHWYAGKTARAWRGQGIYQWASALVRKQLHQEGRPEVFGWIPFDHAITAYALRKMGFQLVKRVMQIRFGSRTMTWPRITGSARPALTGVAGDSV